MTLPERVVFDCNVYFQALIGPGGPAGQAFLEAQEGNLRLFASTHILTELRDVCMRPTLACRFRLTEERVEGFVAIVRSMGVFVEDVPHVFSLERDPDDEHYVDLAVAAKASLIVSRDKDLLSLEDPETPDGRRFQASFPGISILTPVELLLRLNTP